MFHVKHRLFSDAEVPEDDIQQVFDINAASNPTQGAACESDILGGKLRQVSGHGPVKRRSAFLQRTAMASAGQCRNARRFEPGLNGTCQRAQQFR